MTSWPGWGCPASNVEVISDWRESFDYEQQSPTEFVAPGSSGERFTPRLFEGRVLSHTSSRAWHGSGRGGNGGGRGGNGSGRGNGGGGRGGGSRDVSVSDVCMYTGGPAWCMDWCPAGAGSAEASGAAAKDVLAVASHPRGLQRNVIGERVSGPSLIQLWEVSRAAAPAMLLAIAHEAGVTWALRWRPVGNPPPAAAAAAAAGAVSSAAGDPAEEGEAETAASGGGGEAEEVGTGGGQRPQGATGEEEGEGLQLPCLGLLAAALADGRIVVYAVPRPSTVPRPAAAANVAAAAATTGAADVDGEHAAPAANGGGGGGGGSDPLVVRLRPAAELCVPAGAPYLPCCLDWLPVWPNDLLLAGCWDGSALITRVQPGGSPETRLQMLMHIPGEVLPLRSVGWVPPGAIPKDGEGGIPEDGDGAIPKSNGAIPTDGGAIPTDGAGGEQEQRAGSGSSSSLMDLGRSLFFTAGHYGCLRIWDARSPYSPVAELPSTRSWVMCGTWVESPAGVLHGSEDGSARLGMALSYLQHCPFQKNKDVVVRRLRPPTNEPLWSVDHWRGGGIAAFGGGHGDVCVIPVFYFNHARERERKPATFIGGVRQQRSPEEEEQDKKTLQSVALPGVRGRRKRGGSSGRGGGTLASGRGAKGRGKGKRRVSSKRSKAAGTALGSESEEEYEGEEGQEEGAKEEEEGGGDAEQGGSQRLQQKGEEEEEEGEGPQPMDTDAGADAGNVPQQQQQQRAIKLMDSGEAEAAFGSVHSMGEGMRVADDCEAVYCVRWLQQAKSKATWLAHCGAAGMVRCQAVMRPSS